MAKQRIKKTIDELDATLGEILEGKTAEPTLKSRKYKGLSPTARAIAHEEAQHRVRAHILEQVDILSQEDKEFFRMITNIYNSSLKSETKLKVVIAMTIEQIKGDKEAVKDIYYKLMTSNDEEAFNES